MTQAPFLFIFPIFFALCIKETPTPDSRSPSRIPSDNATKAIRRRSMTHPRHIGRPRSLLPPCARSLSRGGSPAGRVSGSCRGPSAATRPPWPRCRNPSQCSVTVAGSVTPRAPHLRGGGGGGGQRAGSQPAAFPRTPGSPFPPSISTRWGF